MPPGACAELSRAHIREPFSNTVLTSTLFFVGQPPRNSRHVFFIYEAGTPEGPFEEQTQTRLYWIDQAGGRAVRWASRFTGELGRSLGAFAVMPDGAVFAIGQLGTEVQPYTESSACLNLKSGTHLAQSRTNNPDL